MLAPFLFNFGLTAAAEALCAQLRLPDDTCADLWCASQPASPSGTPCPILPSRCSCPVD